MDDGLDTSESMAVTGSGNHGAGGRRRPAATEIFRAQLGLLFQRRWSLAGMAILTALPMTVIAASRHGVGSVTLAELVETSWTLPAALSLVWPMIAAWKDDGPSKRAYHWTLPVDRPRLQLLRVAAGWVHLVTGLAVGITLGWATGASIHDGMAVGRGAVLAAVIPSATVLYLVGTVPALTTDRPLLWLFAAYLAVAGLHGVAVTQGWDVLGAVVTEVFTFGELSLTAAGILPQVVSGEVSGSSITVSPWRAAGLWMVITVVLAVSAARLHLERSGDA